MEELEEKIEKFHQNIDNWIKESKIDYGTDFGDKDVEGKYKVPIQLTA